MSESPAVLPATAIAVRPMSTSSEGLLPQLRAHSLTPVTIGLDPSKMNAAGNLRGGIKEVERLRGYERHAHRRADRVSTSSARAACRYPS
jgi:hypothetical protein